jgi:hypothetical protein
VKLGVDVTGEATDSSGGNAMKYMLLMFGHTDTWEEEMEAWTPDALTTHIEYQRQLCDDLELSGELADSQGLGGPALARTVTFVPGDAPLVVDGVYPETKEVLAGYLVVDVADEHRVVEIAAQMSAAPGPAGSPLELPIEVHPVLDASGEQF